MASKSSEPPEIYSAHKRLAIVVLSRDLELTVKQRGQSFATRYSMADPVDTVVEDCRGTMTPHYFVAVGGDVWLQIPTDAIKHVHHLAP